MARAFERLAGESEQASRLDRLELAIYHVREAEISLAMLANDTDFWGGPKQIPPPVAQAIRENLADAKTLRAKLGRLDIP